MTYREFIKKVQDYSGFSDSEAERATEVFMETLATRLTDDEVKNLTAQLPAEMEVMADGGLNKQELWTGNEFLERIAVSQNIDSTHAKKQMHAVWLAMKDAVSAGELNQVKAQLPDDLAATLH